MAGERGLAEQIRTGLDQQSTVEGPTLVVLSKKPETDPLDEVTYRKTLRQHVKEFACIITLFSVIVGFSKLYKNDSSAAGYEWILFGAAFFFVGYLAPRLLVPIYRVWMKFAHILGAVMSTLMVSLAWILMFFPVGIIFKLIGKRVMDLSFKAPVTSYWEDRDEKLSDFKLLERQW